MQKGGIIYMSSMNLKEKNGMAQQVDEFAFLSPQWLTSPPQLNSSHQ